MSENYLDPVSYDAIPVERKQAVQEWIRLVLQPAKTKTYSAYYLKHCFEYSVPKVTNSYMTEGEFKGAMVAAGYEPVDRNAEHWNFQVKSKSPYSRYSRKHKSGYGYTHDNLCICHCSDQEIARYKTLMDALRKGSWS